MSPKRPALRLVPAPHQRRSQKLQHEVTVIVRRHLEAACERAWAEIAQSFDRPTLGATDDPAAPAKAASRELISVVTEGMSRLAVTALVPPVRPRGPRVRWTSEPPRLAAIPGGLRRDAPITR